MEETYLIFSKLTKPVKFVVLANLVNIFLPKLGLHNLKNLFQNLSLKHSQN